jgi:hypothetical protein
MAVSPGIDSEKADQIINYRQNQEIKIIPEIEGIIGQKLIQVLPINTVSSDFYTIESSGYRDKPQSGYAIRATVNLVTNSRYKILYYKTPVHLKQDETATK